MKIAMRTNQGLFLTVSLCLAMMLMSTGLSMAGQKKFTICHKGRTITVAEPAVAAHLAHGDTLGHCISACACPKIYDPVTCGDGKTYANPCLAECAGQKGCSAPCACPETYDPVTCANGETYANACLAECADQTGCLALCACPETYAPVTCADGRTYSNACIAQCNGQTECSTVCLPTP